MFGLYLGGYVGRFLRKHFGPVRSLALMFVLGALSIGILDLPFFPVATILLAASLTGIIDGVGTPLSAELFLGAPALCNLGETPALMLYSILGSAVMSASPVILEFCESSALWRAGVCMCLSLCALLAFSVSKRARR